MVHCVSLLCINPFLLNQQHFSVHVPSRSLRDCVISYSKALRNIGNSCDVFLSAVLCEDLG